MKRTIIYTDGSCAPNPGPGGWGLYCEYYVGDELNLIFEEGEGSKNTTNNIMEMTGFYEALKFNPNTIYTDSSYVVNEICDKSGVIKDGVITGWLKRQLETNRLKKNKELWLEIYEYITKNKLSFELKWVRGHDGNYGNEMADMIANNARKSIL